MLGLSHNVDQHGGWHVAWANCVDANSNKSCGLVVAIANANFPQPKWAPKVEPLHKFPSPIAYGPTLCLCSQLICSHPQMHVPIAPSGFWMLCLVVSPSWLKCSHVSLGLGTFTRLVFYELLLHACVTLYNFGQAHSIGLDLGMSVYVTLLYNLYPIIISNKNCVSLRLPLQSSNMSSLSSNSRESLLHSFTYTSSSSSNSNEEVLGEWDQEVFIFLSLALAASNSSNSFNLNELESGCQLCIRCTWSIGECKGRHLQR